jgi:hypothetical protein
VAVIALIQNIFPVLNETRPQILTGFTRQVYDKFFEVLVEESGHEIHRAKTFDEYQEQSHPKPDFVICAPYPEIGNLAPGIAELARIKAAFEGVPVVVWTTREEEAARNVALQDYGAAAYYTGNLLNAPDDFADMILELT